MESMEQDHDYSGRSHDGGRLPQESAATASAATTAACSGADGFIDRQSQHHHRRTVNDSDLEDRLRYQRQHRSAWARSIPAARAR